MGEHATWGEAVEAAQRLADLTGLEVGVEQTSGQVHRGYVVRLLPRAEHRQGWELRVGVVRPSPAE